MPASLSWREKLRCAKDAGYDFLEISIDETDEKLARLDWSLEERLELTKAAFEEKLPIRTMCLSGHRKYPLGSERPEVRARGLEMMQKAVGLAWDLGVRIIQLAGYDTYYDSHTARSEELFADGIALAVEMAAARGIVLAFETMETDFMNTTAKAMKWVERVNSPYLQIYPDGGNITNAAIAAGVSEIDDLRTGKGHIAALHLKETVPGKFREIPYGTGHVNFPVLIRAALDMGVRLFVTEFWYTGQSDYRATIHEAKAFIDKQFEAAGA
jgi:L-ribulose-5-phosphate 3-epimerase